MAIALALIAVLIPPELAAVWLAGERAAQVVQGVWILKGALVAHALIFLWIARRTPTFAGPPLLARGAQVPEPAPLSERGLIAALLATGLALRLVDLGNGLWFDEIDTLLHYARAPLGVLLTTFDSQNQHILYSLLAHLSLEVFGDSAASLRLPAALLGTASLWAFWFFARHVASRGEALLGTALLAFSYHHLWFSQNARGYTGLLFFTLLGSALFVRLLIGRGGLWTAVGYGLAMALAAWTHATAVIVVLAHAVVWLALLVRPDRRARAAASGLGLLFSGSFSLTLYALVLPQFLGTLLSATMPGVETEWKSPLWLVSETLRGLAAGLPGGLVGLGAGLAVGLLGVIGYGRRGLAVLGLLLLGPLLTAALVVATKHNLWPRFFFFAAGFFCLVAVRGLWVASAPLGRLTSSRWLSRARAALGLLIVAGSAWTIPTAWAPKQDYSGALRFVEEHRAAEDALVLADMTVMPVRDHLAARAFVVDNASELLEIEGRHPATWFLYTVPTRFRAEHPDLWERLDEAYEEAGVFHGTLGDGEILVMLRRAPH